MPSMSVGSWPNSRVLTWLLSNELTHFLQTFATQGVSGALLLEYAEKPDEMDKLFAPGVAEPERPTPTQISALKHAVQNLADKFSYLWHRTTTAIIFRNGGIRNIRPIFV